MKSLIKKLSVLALILVVAMPAAYARKTRGRVLVDRLLQEIRTGRRYSTSRIEMEQRRYERQVLSVMRRRSGLTERQLNMSSLREYVKRNQNSEQALNNLAEVLGSITARGNVTPAQQQATANILAQAVKIGKRGSFNLEPRDILEIDRNWTVQEKDMMADVLTQTRGLLESNPSKSPNRAFEEALQSRGLLEKFNRRCR